MNTNHLWPSESLPARFAKETKAAKGFIAKISARPKTDDFRGSLVSESQAAKAPKKMAKADVKTKAAGDHGRTVSLEDESLAAGAEALTYHLSLITYHLSLIADH